MPASPSEFERIFLERYMAIGIGALTKKDTEALVMYLLDTYGGGKYGPLRSMSNQDVSILLKVPVTKVRQLRYEAALKYGGDVEEQAKARLLVALSKAILEPSDGRIGLIIEDQLAKNWLQGKLKSNGLIFDHSFNTEIVKVNSDGLFDMLSRFFDEAATAEFRERYELLKAEEDQDKVRAAFAKLAGGFAKGAATAGGAGLAALFKQYVP